MQPSQEFRSLIRCGNPYLMSIRHSFEIGAEQIKYIKNQANLGKNL